MISLLVSGSGGRLEEGLGVLIGALTTDELESEVITVFVADIEELIAQGGGV